MKEVRNEHYDVVSYEIDRDNGVVEHKDIHFNSIGYTIDKDKQFEDAMRALGGSSENCGIPVTGGCNGDSSSDVGVPEETLWERIILGLIYLRFFVVFVVPVIYLLAGFQIDKAITSFIGFGLLLLSQCVVDFLDGIWEPLGWLASISVAGSYIALIGSLLWPELFI